MNIEYKPFKRENYEDDSAFRAKLDDGWSIVIQRIDLILTSERWAWYVKRGRKTMARSPESWRENPKTIGGAKTAARRALRKLREDYE